MLSCLAQEAFQDASYVDTQLLDAISTFLNKQRGQSNLSNSVADPRVTLRSDQEPCDRIILERVDSERDNDIIRFKGENVFLDQSFKCFDVIIICGRLGQWDVDVESKTFAFALLFSSSRKIRVIVLRVKRRVQWVGDSVEDFLCSISTSGINK